MQCGIYGFLTEMTCDVTFYLLLIPIRFYGMFFGFLELLICCTLILLRCRIILIVGISLNGFRR